jgi:hypothetical protein
MSFPSLSAPGSRWARAAWVAGGIAIVVLAVMITPWAGTRPGYDPYGWLTWGWRTLHGGLNTNAAPSFKPLPYLFTVVYALAGRAAQLRLWMDTATAVALAGVAVAGHLAYRLSCPASRRAGERWARALAAAIAITAVLGLHDETGETYLHYVLSAQSDPMVVTFVLAAIDCALSRRVRAAYLCAVLASLGRPEVWPFAATAAVWLWRERPGDRWVAVAGALVVVALWFGVPALSSRSWFVAGDNAYHFPGAPRGSAVSGMLHRFWLQTPWPLLAAAGVLTVVAAVRRERAVIAPASAAIAWIAIEIAFTLHGWPGLGRYLFEPSAVAAVLGAACAGRLLTGAAWAGAAWAGAGNRNQRTAARVAGVVLAAAIAAGMVAPTIDQARAERRDIAAQHARTGQLRSLQRIVDELGGAARVRRCGESLTVVEYQSALAFTLGENVSAIGIDFAKALRHSNPLLLFTPSRTGPGWTVRRVRQPRSGRCG